MVAFDEVHVTESYGSYLCLLAHLISTVMLIQLVRFHYELAQK